MTTFDRKTPARTCESEAYGEPGGEIVIYKTGNDNIVLDVRLERESVWLDAHQMAQLFGRDRTVILRHIHNIYKTGELNKEATCAKNAQVAADGKIRYSTS